MKRIKINLKNYVAEEIKMIAEEILAGKVVVLPTDTIYGLSAVVTDKKAIRKIYRIKKRKSDVVVDAGMLPKRKPSRLEDLRNMENIKIFRK